MFIGSSGRRPTAPNGQNGYGPGTGNHPQLGGQENGMQADYRISNLMVENNDLRRRIQMLEQEKLELQQNLNTTASQMAMSGQNNFYQ